MNDESPQPFEAIGDQPVEARIVAWVLGESSAFEAAELERLCEERPELLVFRRRMRSLHGLLTDAEASEADHTWKLPAEKRILLDEIFGQENVTRIEVEKERNIRRSSRRALLAIAACLILTITVAGLMQPMNFLFPQKSAEAIIEIRTRGTDIGFGRSKQSSAMSPQFFGTEFEKIKSNRTLGEVVDNLNLSDRWKVDKDAAITRLKQTVDTTNISGTDLIKIRVNQPNEQDAKEIASELAISYKNYREELIKKDSEMVLHELNKAVRNQEDKVEGRRKVLATMAISKGIIYKGKDSYYGKPRVDEEQAATNREDAVERGLGAQDYVDAKRDFETDQELLQTMRLEQINKSIKNKMPDDMIVIHETPILEKNMRASGSSSSDIKRSIPVTPGLEIADNEPTARPAAAPEPAKPLAPAEAMPKPSEEKTADFTMSLAKSKEGIKENQEKHRRAQFAPKSKPAIATATAPEGSELPELAETSGLLPVPDMASAGLPGGGSGGGGGLASNGKLLSGPSDKTLEFGGTKAHSAFNTRNTKTELEITSGFAGGANPEMGKALSSKKAQSSEMHYWKTNEADNQANNDDSTFDIKGAKSEVATAVGYLFYWDSNDGIEKETDFYSEVSKDLVNIDGIFTESLALSKKVDLNVLGSGPVQSSATNGGMLGKNGTGTLNLNGLRSGNAVTGNDEIVYSDPDQPGDKKSNGRNTNMPTLATKDSADTVDPFYDGRTETTAGSLRLSRPRVVPPPRGVIVDRLEKPAGKDTDGFTNQEGLEGFTNFGSTIAGATKGIDAIPNAKPTESPAPTDGPTLSNLAQGEIVRRQDSVKESDELLISGGNAYAQGDYQTASGKYRDALEKLPAAPIVEDRRRVVSEHLADANVAQAMQDRKVGKYDEAKKLLSDALSLDPANEAAKREMGYLDNPIRSNPALTYEYKTKIDQVRKDLYIADESKKAYIDALKKDPYNQAARRELDRVETAKSDYYRAAYDHTRAELLSKADAAWELPVPDDQKAQIEVIREFAYPTESEPPTKTDPSTAKNTEGEDKTPVLGDISLIGRLFKTTPAIPRIFEPEVKVEEPQINLADLMEEISTSENPYSTFSLNINDASFQLAKAALAKGERPDPESIKPEQFYNAVDYGDPAPSAQQPVAATIEQSTHPIIPGRELVRVALRTASTGRSAAQPLRLTLLVDQSGSMVREDRRVAMENAVKQLGGLLTKNDSVTIIGFSRTPHLLADGLAGDQGDKLGEIINQAASEGGTNLEEAMKLGAQLAERHQLAGAQNRIVLFTDGAANLGNANPEKLAKQVTDLRQKGIAFDIAGIGADGLNDRLLGELSRHGNGRYYVVGDPKNESFARQLAGAFRPAAENVKVQVNFNPQRVGKYKLIGFEKDRLKTEDFRNDSVDAAELAADEAGVAIYQVEVLPEGTGEIGEVSVRFRDTASTEMVERTWTIPHESSTAAFDRTTPSMQLACLSMLAAEKLKGGPMADAIDFKQFAAPLADVKQFYTASSRVTDMLQVIEKLK